MTTIEQAVNSHAIFDPDVFFPIAPGNLLPKETDWKFLPSGCKEMLEEERFMTEHQEDNMESSL